MKLGGIFSGVQQRSDETLLIDIGSSAVRLARASKKENGRLSISRISRYDIPYKKTQNARALQKAAISALLEAVLAEKEVITRVKSCLLALGAPWYESDLLDISIPSEHTALVAAATEKLRDGERTQEKKSFMRFETVVVSYEKNGYLLPSTSRVLGPGLVRTLVADAPLAFFDELWQTLGLSLEKRTHGIHSHAGLILSVLSRTACPIPETGYVVIEVTGEITEVLLFRGGILKAMATIPRGTRAVVRALHTSGGHTSDADAASHELLATQGLLSSSHANARAEALAHECALWSAALNKALTSIAEGLPIPATAYLFASPDFYDAYATSLRTLVSTFHQRVSPHLPDPIVSGDTLLDHRGIECEGGVCDNRILLLAHLLV